MSSNQLRKILEDYQEATAKKMSTDNVNFATIKEENPSFRDVMQWVEDNESWYSIEPRVVTIEVSNE